MNRTVERAEALAESFDGKVRPFDELEEALVEGKDIDELDLSEFEE